VLSTSPSKASTLSGTLTCSKGLASTTTSLLAATLDANTGAVAPTMVNYLATSITAAPHLSKPDLETKITSTILAMDANFVRIDSP